MSEPAFAVRQRTLVVAGHELPMFNHESPDDDFSEKRLRCDPPAESSGLLRGREQRPAHGSSEDLQPRVWPRIITSADRGIEQRVARKSGHRGGGGLHRVYLNSLDRTPSFGASKAQGKDGAATTSSMPSWPAQSSRERFRRSRRRGAS